ncbi:hypothetical protein [Polaribacter staleyi]|uniref:hypothetical protein n=1 Tax=Polaribacter staleyi TaxID=2022337 RepID=UPI0031B9D79A
MYIEFRPEEGIIIGNNNRDTTNPINATFLVETRFTYEIGAWIYVEDLRNPDKASPSDLRFYYSLGFQKQPLILSPISPQ